MERSNLFLIIGVIAASLVVFFNFDTSNTQKSQVAEIEGELNIYNWSDYIAEEPASILASNTSLESYIS